MTVPELVVDVETILALKKALVAVGFTHEDIQNLAKSKGVLRKILPTLHGSHNLLLEEVLCPEGFLFVGKSLVESQTGLLYERLLERINNPNGQMRCYSPELRDFIKAHKVEVVGRRIKEVRAWGTAEDRKLEDVASCRAFIFTQDEAIPTLTALPLPAKGSTRILVRYQKSIQVMSSFMHSRAPHVCLDMMPADRVTLHGNIDRIYSKV